MSAKLWLLSLVFSTLAPLILPKQKRKRRGSRTADTPQKG